MYTMFVLGGGGLLLPSSRVPGMVLDENDTCIINHHWAPHQVDLYQTLHDIGHPLKLHHQHRLPFLLFRCNHSLFESKALNILFCRKRLHESVFIR